MKNLLRATFSFTICLLLLCVGTASAELVIDQNYQLINKKRVGRTTYEYTYQVNISNDGTDVQNVTASVTSSSSHTTIVDEAVSFGVVDGGSTVTGIDTFSFQQNRRYLFAPSALTWNIQFEQVAPTIPPEGGEIEGEGGISLIVPAGATDVPVPVTITELQEGEVGTPTPPNTTFLGGASIDMGETVLNDNADISMPAPEGTPDGTEVYLAKVTEYAGQNMFQLVDTAVVQNGIMTSQDPAFPGVLTTGYYCFFWWTQGAGWIEGQVTNINSGMAIPEAVVTLSGGYWLDIADTNGNYSLPSWAGNFVVNAFDRLTGDYGEKQGFMPSGGASIAINVEIGENSGPTQSALTNGGFEDGLTGWVLSGAGDVVDSFGQISPYEGNYMAMISSGEGALGEASSALEQTFTVPEGLNKLTIHYNFVSEEYPEYVGSQYNDVMQITLHTPDGSREVAFEDVNNANFEPVSDIPCGSGDCTWGQTGWLEASIDVSEWAGTDDTLTITVHDVGDTIFDTVVLVDDISITKDLNQQYFEILLSKARIGDILLFSACDGDIDEPLNCTANVIEGAIEELTGWSIDGLIGFGFFQHAALIYQKGSNDITVLHGRGIGDGVGTDYIDISKMNQWKSIMLLRVHNFSDNDATWVANNAYSRWNNTEYDSFFFPYNSQVYCSELIWDAYNEHGVELNDNSYYPIGLFTPDNILLSENIEMIMGYKPVN